MLWYEPFSDWKNSCVIWYFCCRIDDGIDDTEVEETQGEKRKWEVKLECEQIPKKVRLSWHIEKTDRGGYEKFVRGPVCPSLVSIGDLVGLYQGNLITLQKIHHSETLVF